MPTTELAPVQTMVPLHTDLPILIVDLTTLLEAGFTCHFPNYRPDKSRI